MNSKLCKTCMLENCMDAETSSLVFKNTKKCNTSLGEALWNQQRSGQFCDVVLRSGHHKTLAHKCVLVIESGYFTGLFSGHFRDSNFEEYELPEVQPRYIESILQYLYTGKLEINPQEIGTLYMLSDFLCVESLINFCHEAMKKTLSCRTSYLILETATKYNLTDIQEAAIDFICPFAESFLRDYDRSLLLSHQVFKALLQNNKINYVSESFLVQFLNKWTSLNEECENIEELFKQIDPAYMKKEEVTQFMNHTNFELYIDEQTKVKYTNRLSAVNSDLILCRSRSRTNFHDDIKLLTYNIDEDSWSNLDTPTEISLNGLESMIKHRDTIYFLVTITEDIRGYMHVAKDIKQFFSFTPERNDWSMLPSPQKVHDMSRLVSHINGLFVLDKYGVIEMFDEINRQWFDVGKPIFNTVPSATMNFIPMPMDRYIYIGRIYSLGYSHEYPEFAIALYLYDTISGTSRQLSNVESSELDLPPEERFHGYIIVPGKIFLKDAVGENRVEYDITSGTWECLGTQSRIPGCFGVVWGSLLSKGRSYMVINNSITHNKQHFLMYDWMKKRYKALTHPDCQLSGLMISL